MRSMPVVVCCLLLGPIGCGRPGRPPGPPVAKMSEISASPATADSSAAPLKFAAEDWPMWRGPHADGVAEGPAVPMTWTETENVAWSVKLPGRGHSSPIIVGDRIYLETADEGKKTQSVLCLDRGDGKLIWEKSLFEPMEPSPGESNGPRNPAMRRRESSRSEERISSSFAAATWFPAMTR